jgi:hypothetical protein
MATAYPFQPSASGSFQFAPTLNGILYTGIVTWNLYGQTRPYLNLYLANGSVWVLTTAIVNSTAAQPINLVAGYIPGAFLYFDVLNTQFVTVP